MNLQLTQLLLTEQKWSHSSGNKIIFAVLSKIHPLFMTDLLNKFAWSYSWFMIDYSNPLPTSFPGSLFSASIVAFLNDNGGQRRETLGTRLTLFYNKIF